ncbi:hypothetical protein Bbelb_276520 [Branchiostoma belcheri]|nr:hypothetical protein Bbelb_276520 [Branchiostoma belcheri]
MALSQTVLGTASHYVPFCARPGTIWAGVGVVAFTVGLVLTLVVISLHKQNRNIMTFKVPFAPVLPAIFLFLDICLMVSLRNLSLHTKLRLYNSLVFSILLYGAEAWTLTSTQEWQLDAFDAKCLRRTLGIRWWYGRVTNIALRRSTNQPPVSQKIRAARLQLFGQLARSSPPSEPARPLLEPTTTNWTRPRGRPRQKWLDVLSSDLRAAGLNLTTAWAAAQNRSAWRTVCRDATLLGACGHEDTGILWRTLALEVADFAGVEDSDRSTVCKWLLQCETCVETGVMVETVLCRDYCRKDTLQEDLLLFFQRSGIVGKDSLLPKQHPSRAKANFGNIFREVPTDYIRRLGEIYKPDFDMFGYSFDDDLALIRNELKQNL